MKEVENKFYEISKKHVFYLGKVKHNFAEYSKFLGLTYYLGVEFYINDSNYFIRNTGIIYRFSSNLPTNPKLQRKRCFYDAKSGEDIFNDESIKIINDFLKSLRDHWNLYYSKHLFRKKLKSKLDFSLLIKDN